MPQWKFTERDYKWTIFCLALILLFVFVVFYGGKQDEIVSYVGFAGTITSIVLSVLAIIYTVYQSGASSLQTEELVKASKVMHTVLTDFRTSQVQLEDAVQSVRALGSQVERVDKTVTSMAEVIAQAPPKTPVLVGEAADIESAVQTASLTGLVLLLICVCQAKFPRDSSIYDAVKEVAEKASYTIETEYAWGFLVGFASTGLIGRIELHGKPTVEIPNLPRFEAVLIQTIAQRMDSNQAFPGLLDSFKAACDYVIRLYARTDNQ